MANSKYLYARIAAAFLLVSMVGCASQQQPRNVMLTEADLNHYQLSCADKDNQIAFLKMQMPSSHTVHENRFQLYGMGVLTTALDGTYSERRSIDRGWNQALIKRHIRWLETWCE
jgi:hypothetical protein